MFTAVVIEREKRMHLLFFCVKKINPVIFKLKK
jgi:hypothetical protein